MEKQSTAPPAQMCPMCTARPLRDKTIGTIGIFVIQCIVGEHGHGIRRAFECCRPPGIRNGIPHSVFVCRACHGNVTKCRAKLALEFPQVREFFETKISPGNLRRCLPTEPFQYENEQGILQPVSGQVLNLVTTPTAACCVYSAPALLLRVRHPPPSLAAIPPTF